ncbi:MAG: hypothetical protein HY049_04810 [Acidobacteria bacterium]|nr:hypothetical protein [Acidobacteriota bacterium]
MPLPPRVFEASVAERRNPARADRRSGGRTFAERLAAAKGEGLEEGHRAGRLEALGEIEGLLHGLGEAVTLLHGERRAMLAASTGDLARLSVKIAEKILAQKLEMDPAALSSIVSAALAAVKGSGPVEIRLNPGDAARAEAAGAPLPKLDGVTVVLDPAVPAGGCRLRTEWGDVGAGVPEQLRSVAALFDQEPGE